MFLRLSIISAEEGSELTDLQLLPAEEAPSPAPGFSRHPSVVYTDIELSPVEQQAIPVLMYLYDKTEGFNALIDSLVMAARGIDKEQNLVIPG